VNFEDFARQTTITDAGLRPQWAGRLIAHLIWAYDEGRGGRLTPEEMGLILVIRRRLEARLGEPDYVGDASTVVGWVAAMAEKDPDPAVRQLGAEVGEALTRFHRRRTTSV
jgi:hypothetical protein